jgi:hypothetical protein
VPIWKRKDKPEAVGGASSGYDLADVYVGLREKLLEGQPEQEGRKAHDIDGVWAAAMEMGMERAIATLGVVADSPTGVAVSFYFSNGGGIIGCGQHEGPRHAGRDFLSVAAQAVANALPTSDYPLPRPGTIRFYIRTVDGTYTAGAQEAILASGRHVFSGLYAAGHAVITQVRLHGDMEAPSPAR